MKMKKKTPYLDFYKKYYGKKLPQVGLCFGLAIHFNPDVDNGGLDPHPAMEVFETDDNCAPWGYYGYEFTALIDDPDVCYAFTPLRQTMVLLLAALNDEL